jgi:hypothetical protein
MAGAGIDFRPTWDQALDYPRFVADSKKNCGLWQGVYRTARLPEWAVRQACERAGRARLLAIVEDWCGDASNTVPILARLGDEAECLEMRVIRRDEHPEVMDRYLTNGTRSIPIVIVLDEELRELGHWGPRPAELQAWVVANKSRIPRRELYLHVRRWYAQDGGETMLREVLALLNGRRDTDQGPPAAGELARPSR